LGGFESLKHVVVTRGNHIVGVVRINTGLRRGLEGAYSGVTLGDVAQRNFTLARENDIVFDIVQRMARHDASMAVVTRSAEGIARQRLSGLSPKSTSPNQLPKASDHSANDKGLLASDYGYRCVWPLRHGVLLVFGAPGQLPSLAGQEHGRTIPLADMSG
jgi:hypothetical protein